MEKLKIELPALPNEEILATENRVSELEYLYLGKKIDNEMAMSIFQQWANYVCAVVPATEVKYEFLVNKEESRRERIESNKKSIRNMAVILGASDDFVNSQLEQQDNMLDGTDEDDRIDYYIKFLVFDWKYDDDVITTLDLCFLDNKLFAKVWKYDGDLDYVEEIEYDSWEEAVKGYVKQGEDWFDKYMPPKIDLPVVPEKFTLGDNDASS